MPRFADSVQQRRIFSEKFLVVLCGDESPKPAAVAHVQAERLKFADGIVSAIRSRAFEHAEAGGIDADHRKCPRLVRRFNDVGCLFLERAEVDGIFEINAGDVFRELRFQIRHVHQPGVLMIGNFRNLHLGLAVIYDYHQPVGSHVARDEDLLPAGCARCHAAGDGDGVRPIVGRRATGFESGEIADHGTAFE